MKKTIIAILTTSLFACGGGGGDAPITTSGNDQQAAAEMPSGLWEGIINADGDAFDVVGLVAPNGEARFISDDGEQERFNLVLDGGNYTADGVGYDEYGDFLFDISISGAYTSTSITGTATVDSEETSTFSLSLSGESGDGADLSTITGNYATLDGLTSIAIDVDGLISGSDDDGCVYGGSLAVLDSDINVYDIVLEVSNCGQFNDTYDGLATYAALFDDSPQKAIVFQVDNGVYSVTEALVK